MESDTTSTQDLLDRAFTNITLLEINGITADNIKLLRTIDSDLEALTSKIPAEGETKYTATNPTEKIAGKLTDLIRVLDEKKKALNQKATALEPQISTEREKLMEKEENLPVTTADEIAAAFEATRRVVAEASGPGLPPTAAETHATSSTDEFAAKIRLARARLGELTEEPSRITQPLQAKLAEIILNNQDFSKPEADSIARHAALLDTIMGNLEILNRLNEDLVQNFYANLDPEKLTDPDNLSQELARALVYTVLNDVHEITDQSALDLKTFILEATEKEGKTFRDLAEAKTSLERTQTNLETLGQLARNNPDYKIETRGIAEDLETLQRQKNMMFSQMERLEAAQNLSDFRDKAQIMVDELESMITDYRKGANALWRGFVYIFSPLLGERTKYSKMLNQQREAQTILDQSRKAIAEARASAEKEDATSEEVAKETISEAARLKVKIDALDKKYPEFHEDALAEKIRAIEDKLENLRKLSYKRLPGQNANDNLLTHIVKLGKNLADIKNNIPELRADIMGYTRTVALEANIDSQTAALKRIQKNLEIAATLPGAVGAVKEEIYDKIALLDSELSTEELSKAISRIVASAAYNHAMTYEKEITEHHKTLLRIAVRQIQLRGSGAQGTIDIESTNNLAKDLAQVLTDQKKCIDALAQIIDMDNPDLTKRTIRGYGTFYKRYVTLYSTSPDDLPLDPDAITLSKDIHETLTKTYQEVSAIINKMISTKSAFDSKQKAEQSIAVLEKQVGSLLNITRMYLKVFVYCVPAIYRWASGKEQSATWKEINKHFTDLEHLRQARNLKEAAQATIKTPSDPVAQELEIRVSELEGKIKEEQEKRIPENWVQRP